MRIRIIINEPYPFGMASTVRIHSYAKSFKHLGNDVVVIVPKVKTSPGINPPRNNRKGTFEGIDYYNVSVSNRRSRFLIKRVIGDICGPLKCFRILYRHKRNDVILLVSNDLYHILLFKVFAKFFNALYIQEKSELPPPERKKTKSPVKKITGNLYIRYAYKVFDGIVVISHYLLNYFKNKISKNAKLLLIPIIVDHTQFSINNRQNKKGKVKKIVYAGSLCQDKDGIIDLITAFKILCDKRSDVRLILIGNIDKSKNKTDMLNLVDNFGLADKVKITGFIPRNDLVKNLIEADVLALYKPKTLQNEYCFPTKIGEYLSTGNPVVTTDIGEISYYLKDNYNAFLARAGNIESFAFKLCEALDKKSSKMIGEQGKKTAEEEFNYIKAGEKLIAFFHQLLKYKK